MRNLVLALVALIAACSSSTQPIIDHGPFVRRPFPDGVLARKAIAYSGYRTGQSPDIQQYPSEEEIRQDLGLLAQGGWGFLRLFDAGVHAERTLKVIHDGQLDFKVLLGVWIAGGKATADAANRVQIDKAIALAEQYPDIVVAISVGNETLDSWSNVRTPPADLAAYIAEVRDRVELPVTTDDSYLPFLLGQDGDFSYADVVVVLQAIDFVSIHVYAFADAFWDSWDYKQLAVPESERAAAMMAAAIAYTKDGVRQVRDVLEANHVPMPIVIGELGWKSATKHDASAPPEDAIELFFAHPVNQKMFYDAMLAWTYGDARDADSPDAAFHFEAFDEPWKDEWGDDGWGLFDVNRKAKYVLWDVFPTHKPADAPAYSAADAVYYRAP